MAGQGLRRQGHEPCTLRVRRPAPGGPTFSFLSRFLRQGPVGTSGVSSTETPGRGLHLSVLGTEHFSSRS